MSDACEFTHYCPRFASIKFHTRKINLFSLVAQYTIFILKTIIKKILIECKYMFIYYAKREKLKNNRINVFFLLYIIKK